MAGASMKSIKLRIHSMQNTRQITKAMEMVAASKMNKAQEKALRTRPYYTTLHSTLSGIAAATRDFSSPYLQKREEKRVCCVAIAGDRGLAGGYNSNVLRLAAETLTGEENCVVPIGKKAGEYFRHRGAEILTEDWLTAEEKRLLKAADRLSALIKCTEEQRSGNHEFDAALTQQRAALQAMHCPEADWFIEHCLPCYTQNLDELTRQQ